MPGILDLPEIVDFHAFNIERWEAICAEPAYASLEGRIESDEYGNAVMMPPPNFGHARAQSLIARKIDSLLGTEQTATECPVSTSRGVKAADVIWISADRERRAFRSGVLVIAPEICVEIISPANTRGEMEEKKALYFEGGAEEVWFCDSRGQMHFFLRGAAEISAAASVLCPSFPAQIALPHAAD